MRLSHRVAFDIGSGSVKMQSAWIDESTWQIMEKTEGFYSWIPIRDYIDLHPQGEISRDVMEDIIQLILEAKRKAFLPKVSSAYIGAATEAFRIAKNGKEALSYIKEKTGVILRCLSQEEEATLGRNALQVEGHIPPGKSFLSWENGGGSMQITGSGKKAGEVLFFNKKLGKIPFKNYVLQRIQRKTCSIFISPNPISQEEALEAIAWLDRELGSIPSWLIEELIAMQGEVIGFGAMFPILRQQLGHDVFTKKEIWQLVQSQLGRSDIELSSGEDPTFQVLDPLFLYAVMDVVGIESVSYKKISGSTASLLVSSEKWS